MHMTRQKDDAVQHMQEILFGISRVREIKVYVTNFYWLVFLIKLLLNCYNVNCITNECSFLTCLLFLKI